MFFSIYDVMMDKVSFREDALIGQENILKYYSLTLIIAK